MKYFYRFIFLGVLSIKSASDRFLFLGFASIVVFPLLFLSSCGYSLQGSGKLPQNIDTISVNIFENRSSVINAETIFTNALIKEFMRNSLAKVINTNVISSKSVNKSALLDSNLNQINQEQINQADCIVTGTIKSISLNALARTSDDKVYKRGVNAVINIEMKNRAGDIIFAADNLTESEFYSVSGDNSIDDESINKTVKKLAQKISRKIVGQMSDDF